MTDLLKRLEEAEAGSRELSDAVLLACGWTFYQGGVQMAITGAGGGLVDVWTPPNPTGESPRLYSGDRPSPTQSLDDALGLVPEGWIVGNLGQKDSMGWHCELKKGYQTSYSGVEIGHNIKSPALALCIAVLKAREAEEER